MERAQEMIEEHDLEFPVELEECLEEISFIPRPAGEHPFPGIFEGPEYVVNVNDHALLE